MRLRVGFHFSGPDVYGGFNRLLGTGPLPPLLCIPSGCGHPLGQVCLFVTLDRERRIPLVIVPFQCCHPFLGSSCRIPTSSFGSSELIVAGGCTLALLVVVL